MSREEQAQVARTKDTAEVYRLYRALFHQPPPWFTELDDVLGERGIDALVLWVADIENTEKSDRLSEGFQYAPMLIELKNGHRSPFATMLSCSSALRLRFRERATEIGQR